MEHLFQLWQVSPYCVIHQSVMQIDVIMQRRGIAVRYMASPPPTCIQSAMNNIKDSK